MILKRDRASLALHSSLNMDSHDAMSLLNNFPQLYTDLPILATRISPSPPRVELLQKKNAEVASKVSQHDGMSIIA